MRGNERLTPLFLLVLPLVLQGCSDPGGLDPDDSAASVTMTPAHAEVANLELDGLGEPPPAVTSGPAGRVVCHGKDRPPSSLVVRCRVIIVP